MVNTMFSLVQRKRRGLLSDFRRGFGIGEFCLVHKWISLRALWLVFMCFQNSNSIHELFNKDFDQWALWFGTITLPLILRTQD